MFGVILDHFKRRDVEYTENCSIKKESKIKIGGNARVAVSPNTEEKLIKTVKFLYEHNVKHKVVGAMSNILPCDSDYEGVIVKTSKLDTYYVAENEMYASCGCYLPLVIQRVASVGVGGLAEISSIPARVGGAVRGNAGAFGLSVSDVLTSARVYDYENDSVYELDNRELGFSYRDSTVKHKPWVVLSCKFKTVDRPSYELIREIEKYRDLRKATQPSEPSLGSTFKRLGDIAVSQLIDRAGLKGLRVGDAAVSEKHAGFIVNLGSATADDYIKLVGIIKQRIFNEYGIMIEEEIELLC